MPSSFRGRGGARALLVTTGVAICLCGGCTILAGINEGYLGTRADSGVPSGDASADTTLDAPAESTPDGRPDAPVDGSLEPVDAASDPPGDSAARPPAQVTCTQVPGAVIAVDESSNYDSGATPGFLDGVWLAKTTTKDQLFLYAQLASDPLQFLEYELDFTHHTVQQGRVWRGLGPSLHLVSISSVPAGANTVWNAALTTFPAPASGFGDRDIVQVIPLASNFGGPVIANTIVGPPLVARVESASFFLRQNATSADWLLAVDGTNVARYGIYANSGTSYDASPSGPAILGRSAATKYFVQNAPFFEMGGALHAFVSGVDPDGGATAFTLPEDLADAANTVVSGSVIPGSTNGRVVSARPSAAVPSKALVVAVVPDATGMHQGAYGALVDPAQLSSFAIAAPTFTQGALLPNDVVPLGDPSGLAWADDETLLFGPGPVGTGLYLVWLGPDGHAVFQAPNKMPLFDDAYTVSSAAVQFGEHDGELGATLFAAWIETVDAAGNQAIKAVEVSCTPVGP